MVDYVEKGFQRGHYFSFLLNPLFIVALTENRMPWIEIFHSMLKITVWSNIVDVYDWAVVH